MIASLSPRSRVTLIRELRDRLSKMGGGDIGLTLRQFGVPCGDLYGSDMQISTWIMDCLEPLDDSSLLSLGNYMCPDVVATIGPSSSTATLPSADEHIGWAPRAFRVFISHLAKHRRAATSIKDALRKYAISAFVAHDDIEPTDEWIDVIESALATCHGMLVLVHPGFHDSKWTDQEVGYAMGRQLLIVTVRCGLDPYGFLGRFQAIDGTSQPTEGIARRIYNVFCRHRKTNSKIAHAVAARFADSQSYADTKRNMELLEGLTYWDATMTEMTQTAVAKNDQVSGAWHVPDKLERLVTRHLEKGANERGQPHNSRIAVEQGSQP